MKNIFVIGLNEFNREKLESLRNPDHFQFHELLSYKEVTEQEEYPVLELLAKAEQRMDEFNGSIDGVLGYMDFPVSTLVPVLSEKFGLRSAPVSSFIKCEHKYWSRLEQQQSIPEHIPQFCLFDPFSENPAGQINLHYPYWIKPVKSFGSHLGFRINNRQDLDEAIPVIREHITRISRPFDLLLDHLQLNMPNEVAGVSGHHFLAESLIGGLQCTMEGCMYENELYVHGIVDSIRYPNRSVFFRYQYPSSLPRKVQRRMETVARTFLRHIGYNNSAFNMEFFWDRRKDKLYMLEVNTRIAQHHSDLFHKVDGVSNHKVPVDLVLGKPPHIPEGKGEFKLAAACFYREFQNAWVSHVPSGPEIAKIEQDYPGTIIQVDVCPDMYLSDLVEQDSYSYILALIYLGADNQKTMLSNYRKCLNLLNITLEPLQQEVEQTYEE